MQERVVLAIDLGTTGNRVIAFSQKGEVVFKSYYEFHQIFPQPGWVEHSPYEILSTTLKALKDVLSFVGAENVVSIGITNQRETTILWDVDSGQPLYNAIVWQDKRTKEMCDGLKEYRNIIKEKTGLFLDPYFSATKIKWVIDNVEGVKEKIDKGKVCFGTPDTWMIWNLTGGKVFATEPSNASRTLLFNISTRKFDRELLKIFRVHESVLPEVKDSDSLFGYTDKNITGKEIPIIGVLGDQQASLFAHCGWEEGIIKNTYGTGLFVLYNTQDRLYNLNSLLCTIAWQLQGKVSYAVEGSIFMGGAVIQWLRDNLKIIKVASDSEKIAESLSDNEGVYFVPAFQGLGAPFWVSTAKGAIVGLTRRSSRETIVRAALESLAYQTRAVIDEMKKETEGDFNLLRVDGGACLNNFLMQFQANILGMKVERPKIIETTALGAAGISGIGSGFWDTDEFKMIRTIDRVFKPEWSMSVADKYYYTWNEIVQKIVDLPL